MTLVEITAAGRVVLQFGGGCNGCAMVDVPLKEGIEKELQVQFPELTSVQDVTEHQAGAHSYLLRVPMKQQQKGVMMAQLVKKSLAVIVSMSLLLVSAAVCSAHHPVQPLPNDLSHSKQIRETADQGDPESQYQLGDLYRKGVGGSPDYRAAVEWYRKAAKQGHAAGQNSLGLMYIKGQGVAQNYKTALEWYCKAAEQGHSEAKQRLQQLQR